MTVMSDEREDEMTRGEDHEAGRLAKLADWIERDRHEPDKVLAYSQEVRRLSRCPSPERDTERLVEALRRIRDHGETHDEPCWALHNGDCADVMQEIARATLAEFPDAPEREDARDER